MCFGDCDRIRLAIIARRPSLIRGIGASQFDGLKSNRQNHCLNRVDDVICGLAVGDSRGSRTGEHFVRMRSECADVDCALEVYYLSR